MRMYGRLALHAESVVLPLLAPDAPVVTWWYGDPPHLIAHDPLGVFADRRVTDCALAADPLDRAARSGPRTTPRATPTWPGPARPAGGRCAPRPSTPPRARRRGRGSSAEAGDVSRALLAGWLTSRLGIEVQVEDSRARASPRSRSASENTVITLCRGEGLTVVLSHTDQPDRTLPLPSREPGRPARRGAAAAGRRRDLRRGAGGRHRRRPGCRRARRPATHVWVDPAAGRRREHPRRGRPPQRTSAVTAAPRHRRRRVPRRRGARGVRRRAAASPGSSTPRPTAAQPPSS